MDGTGPSRTAWGAAKHRAAHQIIEGGSIFHDPSAVTIVGMPESDLAEQARAHPGSTPMRLFIAARHARGDEVVAAALEAGTRQVVVLGAGLDTTAYRLVAPQGTTVFEVDHPATQQWKREQVAAVMLEPTTALMHVGVDLERDPLIDALVRAGLDPEAPVVCVWLGVVPYMTHQGIETTLRAVASIPGAEVVFDYGEPAAARSPQALADGRERARQVAALGEPWLSHFDPPRLHALLASVAFDVVRDDDARDLVRDYLALPRDPSRRPGGHVLHARAHGGR